jgi:hypothetical protein
VDHSQSHDLVGCQDILWDVAGASVELGSQMEHGPAEFLADGSPLRLELLQFLRLCYVAFQLGWWSYSSDALGRAHAGWYRARLRDVVPGWS